MVCDVTGHGFYAGLFVAMAKSCLHTQAQFSFDPREVMQAMRRTLDLSIVQRLLMSCCYVLFEPRARRLHYANAGHPYPYLYRAKEGFLYRLEALDPILGALDVAAGGYAERTLPWEPGDVLVMYTDGVTEAQNLQDEFFGDHRLIEASQENLGGSVLAIQDALMAAVNQFSVAGGQCDDETLVIIKRQQTR